MLVNANAVPSLPILFTLMIEELSSSEMSVLTRATRRHISDVGIHHSHRCGNLKSPMAVVSYNKPSTYQLQWSATEHSSTCTSHSHKLQQA
jgi:L,D-peptidoglycan transpeptidase YkuD (ErfK/YbiS/YcfS/YnhG family)